MRTSQKIRKTPSGEWVYVSFSAHPDEVARWKKIAKSADRTLSWWLRFLANSAVAAELKEQGVSQNEISNRESEKAPLENVSTDRT